MRSSLAPIRMSASLLTCVPPPQGFPEDGSEGTVWRTPRVTLRHVAGSASQSSVLREAGVGEADAVIVGSAPSLEAKEVSTVVGAVCL